MPVIFDPEYQVALEKYTARTIRENKGLYWILLYMALAFAGVFGALQAVEADAPTVISAMIVVASLGLAFVVITVGTIIRTSLVLIMVCNEWIGKKQLGEYSPPTGP